MTATPHNGKETDFQLFLALLDGDRFEGRFRDGVHRVDVSDLMRRMVKEKLLNAPCSPNASPTPSPTTHRPEARLYTAVTEYVREEFNRAEALQNDKRSGTVGFALAILRRRLASAPEAIYESFRRRRVTSPLNRSDSVTSAPMSVPNPSLRHSAFERGVQGPCLAVDDPQCRLPAKAQRRQRQVFVLDPAPLRFPPRSHHQPGIPRYHSV